MKNPASWSKTDLHNHLKQALDLELWTIPLYLTALYSIKDIRNLKHKEFPDAAKLIFSVVIQEMLHVELVCNLTNALGFAPKFNFPEYNEAKGIPFIHPLASYLPDDLKGYKVKPQALNKHSLQLFCAIELPHPKKDLIWEHEAKYNSIAEFYWAIKTGVEALWDTYYVGDNHNTKQKNTFKEYYNKDGKNHGFSVIIDSKECALKAIEAIIEQGEGADAKHVPADFRPPNPKDEKAFDTAWYKGQLSHYQKFRILLHSHHKLPPVHEENRTENCIPINSNMRNAFFDFWDVLETNFNTDGEEMLETFWNQMFGLAHSLADVWEAGMCPDLGMEVVNAED